MSHARPAAAPAYSRGYLIWAMVVLTAIYTSNFVDRTILTVVQQPIKEELKLTDQQLGLLGGAAFAVLYSTLGVPIARLAEHRSRKTIISIAVVIWSVMTALCGTAGGYAPLFAFRIGVGVGEAGASPPSHSMIADYFPAHRRSTALAVYSIGINLGVLIGAAVGGWLAKSFGWRAAFVWVGLPGLVLAALAQFTLREPPRGHSDAAERPPQLADTGEVADPPAAPTLWTVVRHLAARRAFLHNAWATTLVSFAGYGIGQFAVVYFIRQFHMGLAQAGLMFGLIGGVAAGFGTLAGGLLTDLGAKRDARWYVWTPAIALCFAAPLYFLGYSAATWPVAIGFLALAAVLHYTYLAPSFAVMHNMTSPRMRATGTALLLLVLNLVGLGLGPWLVGLGSDMFASHIFHAALLNGGDFAHACPGGRAPAGSAPALAAACAHASAQGVRDAIRTCLLVFLWGAAHYALAAKDLRRNLER